MNGLQLRLDAEEFAAVKEQTLRLRQEGVDVDVELVQGGGAGPDEHFVVESLLIGGALFAVAKLVFRWWKLAQPGVVIDQREGAEKNIYRDEALPGNYIVTFGPDGSGATVEVKDEDEDAIERILGKVLDVLAKPVEAVGKTLAEALKKALDGENAKISEGRTGGTRAGEEAADGAGGE